MARQLDAEARSNIDKASEEGSKLGERTSEPVDEDEQRKRMVRGELGGMGMRVVECSDRRIGSIFGGIRSVCGILLYERRIHGLVEDVISAVLGAILVVGASYRVPQIDDRRCESEHWNDHPKAQLGDCSISQMHDETWRRGSYMSTDAVANLGRQTLQCCKERTNKARVNI